MYIATIMNTEEQVQNTENYASGQVMKSVFGRGRALKYLVKRMYNIER